LLKSVFVAWTRLSRRTKNLAEEVGAELLFIPGGPPYLYCWKEVNGLLKSREPDIVLVQLPQGPLLWRVVSLSEKMGFRVVADVHTGFIYTTTLKEFILNRPFQHLLRKVDLTLAHNEPQSRLILKRVGLSRDRIIVVYDPLPKFSGEIKKPFLEGLEPCGYLILPSSWASDEPLDTMIMGFLNSRVSREYKLAITGNPERNPRLYRRIMKFLERRRNGEKVILTGYLSDPEYYWLVQNARAVVGVTTREYTMLSAIWEAISFRKLFLIPENNTLREIIGECYPCFYQLRIGGLKEALEKCLQDRVVEENVTKTINRLTVLSHESIERLRKKFGEL